MIDSWAWIEYFKGTSFGEKAKEFIEGKEEILVSSINISEVYKFLLKEKTEKEAEEGIQFVLKSSFVIPVSVAVALKAARLKWQKKFGLADAIVLASAQLSRCNVVTGDDNFKKETEVVYIGT